MGKNKQGFEVMKERARDLRNELYLCKDPDKAYTLVLQTLQESEDWMQRYSAEDTAIVWVPVFKAALDAVAAIQKYLDGNPDIQQEQKDKFRKLINAVEEIQRDNKTPGSVLIKPFDN